MLLRLCIEINVSSLIAGKTLQNIQVPRIAFPRISQFSTNRTLSLWQYLLQHVYVISIVKVRKFYLKMASASSDSVPVDDIKDLLTCSMCSETLNEPKSLSCLHNFCKSCLGEYINFV